MSNSLTTAAYQEQYDLQNTVKILNPLSNELAVLRNTLYFSGLEAVTYNQNRKQTESKKSFGDDGTDNYQKHKIFLYKEDFEKFKEGLDDVLLKIEELKNK